MGLVLAGVAGGVAASATLWLVGLFLLSRLGGWWRLREAHPGPALRASPLYSGQVGGVRYRGALRLRADPHGLALDVVSLLRPFHGPVRFPWDSVRRLTPRRVGVADLLELEVEGVAVLLPRGPWQAYLPPRLAAQQ